MSFHGFTQAQNIFQDDTPKNRELIVKLIFSSFFNKTKTPEETYKRLSKFITVNPNAVRYLAMYSSNELPFEEAVKIMHYILKIMGDCVEKKMKVLSDVDKNKELEATTKSTKSKTGNKSSSDPESVSEDGKQRSRFLKCIFNHSPSNLCFLFFSSKKKKIPLPEIAASRRWFQTAQN